MICTTLSLILPLLNIERIIMATFQHYIEQAKLADSFSIDASWAQGRNVFGGLSTALLLTHIEANTDFTDRELRSINVQFCAALFTDEPVDLSYELLAQGKSVAHVQAKLKQGGNIKTIINCCFARERPSGIEIDATRIDVLPLDKAQKFPFIEGLVPNFVQHIDMRLNSKNFPFSGSDSGTIKGWMHFENRNQPLSDSAILALIDAWPPATLPLLKSPAPSSSVTWNIEFIHPRPSLPQEHALYYECNLVQAANGLAHTEARVFSHTGHLIALSRQLVAIYDKRS